MLELLEGVAMKTTQTCGEEDRWSNGQLEHLGMHPCRPNITLQYDDLHSDAVDARGQATRMVWYMCECLQSKKQDSVACSSTELSTSLSV